MPQRIMTELWDYIAQRFRDTLDCAPPDELTFRLNDRQYSVSELAWRALGSCYQWSSVLNGADSIDDVVAADPGALDLLQTSQYPPGGFPESMSPQKDILLARTDDIVALIGAQLSELPPAARSQTHTTWRGDVYTGDEIVARLMYLLSYCNGQINLLLSFARNPVDDDEDEG